MGKVITLTNQKGGVGKTTSTTNLGSALKRSGKKVLVLDLDPQGNLTFSVNANNVLSATMYEVLSKEVKLQHAIQRLEHFDVVSSNILLSGIELEFTGEGREYLLKDALEGVKDHYDYILIDTPPGLGVLTVNALTASDSVIIPMVADIFSLQGIVQLNETILHVKKFSNADLKVEGVLLNKYNRRLHLSREVVGAGEFLFEQLEIPLFKSTIRNSIAVTEAQSSQKDLWRYAKRHVVTKDYDRLVKEIEGRLNHE